MALYVFLQYLVPIVTHEQLSFFQRIAHKIVYKTL